MEKSIVKRLIRLKIDLASLDRLVGLPTSVSFAALRYHEIENTIIFFKIQKCLSVIMKLYNMPVNMDI